MGEHRTTRTYYMITRLLTVVILPLLIYVLQLFGKASLPLVLVMSLLFCVKVVGDALTLLVPLPLPTRSSPPRTLPAPQCRYCATRKGALIHHPVRTDAQVCQRCYQRYLLSPAYLHALLGSNTSGTGGTRHGRGPLR